MIENDLLPSLSADTVDRDSRSYDFGRMIGRTPALVARPKTVEEVTSIVRYAAREGIPIAVRGGGHSQGGQSLTDRGLMIDTMYLNRVQRLAGDLVRAQGGSRWGKVVHSLRGTGQLPRVLADTADVTVGGTLSVGGLGTTSNRYGLQVGQVEQLEVVTGTGERIRCSDNRNASLFDAVRSGQGQFGIVTEAWIRLRRAGARLRQFELRYRDFDRFARDFEQVVGEDRFDHLRVETRVHEQEFTMAAAVEYLEDCDDVAALGGLGFDEIVTDRDTVEVALAGMYPRWAFSRRMYHPWRDWLMPWETLRTVLAQPWLDPDWVSPAPGSWTGIYPIETRSIDAPILMHPKGKRIFSYSILAVFDRYEKANELAGRLKEIDRRLIELGGKAYLSGRVGYGRKEWKEHYGDKFELGLRWKEEFDPKWVFRGEGMPFGQTLAASGGSAA